MNIKKSMKTNIRTYRGRAGTAAENDPVTGKKTFSQPGQRANSQSKIHLNQQFKIDDLFGKIFGIERVHILKRSDSLKDVIEKITLAPENKLVYIEHNNEGKDSFLVQNVLTLKDFLAYVCPT
jgi:hypothetical protein